MSPEHSATGSTKSTVRQRKKTAFTSTQRFLPIGEIRNDTVLLKNGGLRAIVQVEALNFNLKSETEQLGIISGYESFVNTLAFPLQIVIRSSKMNIDPYLVQLRTLASNQTSELLRTQTLAYADFVEKLVDIAEIMQKKFYVVVPLDQSMRKKTMFEKFFGWFQQDDGWLKAADRNREFLGGRKTLQERVNLVQTGLENIGLQSKRLETQELIQLFYEIYNPGTSQEQKLPQGSLQQLNFAKNVL
jgi:hypothetical protein